MEREDQILRDRNEDLIAAEQKKDDELTIEYHDVLFHDIIKSLCHKKRAQVKWFDVMIQKINLELYHG